MLKLIKSTFYHEKDSKKKLIEFINKTSQMSMGEQCSKYEKIFAKKQKRKYAVFVNSGSSANLALIQTLLNLGKLKRGDKVGFSALTWSTNVAPIIQLGLVPVAIDCNEETLNISPQELQPYVSKIKCLFLTNVLGFCDHIEQIKKICLKNKIIFLEDNCEALGSESFGKLLGNFGLASTFSFFVGHHFSTIEGGMICTDDEDVYNMLVMVRAHGWDRNLPPRKQKIIRNKYKIDKFFAKYTFYDLGYNLRPTEINGFIGNLQIKYWDEIISQRQKNFLIFQNLINKNKNFISLKIEHMDIISNFSMPLICKNEKLFRQYQNKFTSSNIEIRPIIAGDITKQPFYKKYIKDKKIYKNADFIHRNAFYFANNPELTKKEINLITKLLINN